MPRGVYKHSRNQGMYGKRHSNETRLRISRKKKANPTKYWLGKNRPTPSIETRIKLSEANKGVKSHLWKGGRYKGRKKKVSLKYKLWRENVFKRDNYTCRKYGIKGCKLHAHHIKNYSQFPELRFLVENGITLSEKAHIDFHRIYGSRNNNIEQIIEFLK